MRTPVTQQGEAIQTSAEVTRTISLSDFLRSGVFGNNLSWMCCSLLFKDLSAAWVLFNISPLNLSSPPQRHFYSGWQEVIWSWWKQSIWKSNRLGREVPLFDLVCWCWFWEWETVTAGVLSPVPVDVLWQHFHQWFLSEATEANKAVWRGKCYRGKSGLYAGKSEAIAGSLRGNSSLSQLTHTFLVWHSKIPMWSGHNPEPTRTSKQDNNKDNTLSYWNKHGGPWNQRLRGPLDVQ